MVMLTRLRKRKIDNLLDRNSVVETFGAELASSTRTVHEAVSAKSRSQKPKESREFEKSEASTPPTKRLRTSENPIRPANPSGDNPLMVKQSGENHLNTSGINSIPAETFGLINTYVGLNDLDAGTRNLTKMHLLSKRLSALMDYSTKMKQVEATLHARLAITHK